MRESVWHNSRLHRAASNPDDLSVFSMRLKILDAEIGGHRNVDIGALTTWFRDKVENCAVWIDDNLEITLPARYAALLRHKPPARAIVQLSPQRNDRCAIWQCIDPFMVEE